MDLPLILLSLAVFAAGFVDAAAGGGGLITFPAYMNYGLKTELLLGTNKLSSFFGTLIAVIKYFSEISFARTKLLLLFFCCFLGSFLGAAFISSIPPIFIKYFLIAALPALSILMFLKSDFGLADFSSSIEKKVLYPKLAVISFAVSFYDGMLGPGTGTILAFSYCRFCGYDLLKATALAKFSNLISNLSALLTFLYLGKADIKLGLMMAAVSAAGNFLGSRTAIKNGASFIKPAIFIVSNALLIKVVCDMVK